jgi:hypothetical protein
MPVHKVGAIASFVLTGQFLATLLWVAVSWPPEGLAGLADAMAVTFLESADQPVTFVLLNLYNVSFGLSALVLAVVLREMFPEFTLRIQLAVYVILIAAVLFFASGVIPMIGGLDLIHAGDDAGVDVIIAISKALVLGATMACGIAVLLFAWVCLISKRVPFGLCLLLFIAGPIEIVEFAVPLFLPLDPLIGTIWSIWVGVLLWQNRLAPASSLPKGG